VSNNQHSDRSVLLGRELRRSLLPYALVAGFLSVVINILMLVSPIYMLQVYDRILTSGSLDTLLWLTIIALTLLSLYALVEAARRRVFSLAGRALETKLTDRLFATFFDIDQQSPGIQTDLLSLQRVQNSLQSGLLSPFLDVPFIPLYIGLLYLVHPVLGSLASIGAVVLIIVAVLGQIAARTDAAESEEREAALRDFLGGLAEQRTAIVSMGMTGAVTTAYTDQRAQGVRASLRASRTDGLFAGFSRSLRQNLQILILGLGAFLALGQEVSAGSIVAGSILMGRALAPIDQAIHGWGQLLKLRHAFRRLFKRSLVGEPDRDLSISVRPKGNLSLAALGISVPGSKSYLVRPFSLEIGSRSLTTIVGPNGAGKSSLLQTISGAWTPAAGSVSLDGRDVHRWHRDDRGQYVGYLPQRVDILPGTVRENICRFDTLAPQIQLMEAVELVGALDLINSFPDGFDTPIGCGGHALSAGQAQIIGLARAVHNQPSLLLLDEPTANLDSDSVSNVVVALRVMMERGACVIASTHDPRLITLSSKVLYLKNGKVIRGNPSNVLSTTPGDGETARILGHATEEA